MTVYTVHYTDLNAPPISIPEGEADKSTDIALFGRVKLEYGQDLNEDILHLLENFACPEAAGSTIANATPDFSVNGNSLITPSSGQIWYNSTRQSLFYWNGTKWRALAGRGDYSANWGQINDGNQIPRPVNQYTGAVADYTQCIWAVSPANIPMAFSYMLCTTDINANVTMKYRSVGGTDLIPGVANFLIISIVGNQNNGSLNVSPLPPLLMASKPTRKSKDTKTAKSIEEKEEI